MIYAYKTINCVVFLVFFLIQGCSTIPSPMDRLSAANAIASSSQMKTKIIHLGDFSILSYYKINQSDPARKAYIYIEGDGVAYKSRNVISSDPTPYPPLALNLAASHLIDHSYDSVIYLARPCQFLLTAGCDNKWWTSHRFAQEMVDSVNGAISNFVQNFGLEEITLVGYSGGGAIATIISAKRKDVNQLITVAGNMNHKKWTKDKGLTSMKGSLNPVDFAHELKELNQIHIAGLRDTVMPYNILQSYLNEFNRLDHIKVLYENFDHHCCWAEHWSEIIKKYGILATPIPKR